MHLTPSGFPQPSLIVLASGGIRVLSYIGALEVLAKYGCLRRVTTWAGVSGGALIATALAFGYTFDELRQICEGFDFGILKNITEESPIRLLEGSYGLDSGETLARFVRALAHVKGIPEGITFRELAERGSTQPALRIWVSNLDRGELELYSAGTTPAAEVLVALRASMTIPLIYEPVRGASGELLVDGATFNSYPIYTLTADERADMVGMVTRVPLPKGCPRTVTGYLKHCIAIAFEYRSSPLVELFRDSTIEIGINFVGATDFSLTAEERRGLQEVGRLSTLRYLKAHKERRVAALQTARRNSI